MRKIEAQEVLQAVVELIIKCSQVIRPDILHALQQAKQQENLGTAKEVIGQLLDNAAYAAKAGLPLCQDCGTACFYVEHGEDFRLNGDTLANVLHQATVQGYEQGFLRKSMCHPLTRQNTGNNTPAMVHVNLVPGDQLKIKYMAKGGGSENMSQAKMLTPSQGWQGIKDFVVQGIALAGANPCPPIIVGLGIGGSFDQAPVLAKKALFRTLKMPNPLAELASLEAELLIAINALGIGPMGLGGVNTCLAVHVEMLPCHIASLPVAMNIQCHSARHGELCF